MSAMGPNPRQKTSSRVTGVALRAPSLAARPQDTVHTDHARCAGQRLLRHKALLMHGLCVRLFHLFHYPSLHHRPLLLYLFLLHS
jgi:hypothetical protein